MKKNSAVLLCALFALVLLQGNLFADTEKFENSINQRNEVIGISESIQVTDTNSQAIEQEERKYNSDQSIELARRGCCSWHGGVCGCDSSLNRIICCDGTLSPSCTCSGY
jgi:hypothetical protein